MVNDKELRIVLYVGRDKKVAEIIRNKDYAKFEHGEEIQSIFDGVKVAGASQLPGLKDRVTGFFSGIKNSSLEVNPGEGISNFALTFHIDPKIVATYINGAENNPLVLNPTSDDIELAKLEVISSLKNEPRSVLASSNTPKEFIDALKRQLLVIGVGLEHIKDQIDEQDLIVASSFWLLKYESDLVSSCELVERVNESLAERRLDEINIVQLVGTLDKLNKLCVGTEVYGINDDLFTVDMTCGRKDASDDYIIEQYRKIILEEPVSTYSQFLTRLGDKVPDRAQILEIILNRKLRLSPLDYSIVVASRLCSCEDNELDFRTIFSKVLLDNNINYEITPGDDFEKEIEKRVGKINRTLGNVIELARQEEVTSI